MIKSLETYVAPYINGQFLASHKSDKIFQNCNPACPKDILAQASWNHEWFEPLCQGMAAAQKVHSHKTLEDSVDEVLKIISILKENAEEIKSLMMLELSRSRISVESEWSLCELLFEGLPSFCRDALAEQTFKKKLAWHYIPLGFVLVGLNISLPVYSLLWGLLPALVAGNAVCLRPSSHCLLSSSLIASCIHQACLYPGVVQIVYGDFELFRKLLLSQHFHTILFTGSEENLSQLRRDASAQPNLRLALSPAGKNGIYIDSSADLKKAVEDAMTSCFLDAGQRLESCSLIFIQQPVFEEFCQLFIQAVKGMPIGAKQDLDQSKMRVMEPLCSHRSWELFLRFQGIAARQASETLRWGKPIDNVGNGYYVSPGVHVMDFDKVAKSIYASDAFLGPDACLVAVDECSQAVAVMNSLPATRCFSVFASTSEILEKCRLNCRVPLLLSNEPTTRIHPNLPLVIQGALGFQFVSGLWFLHATVMPISLDYGE